jgi:hypothetical protein
MKTTIGIIDDHVLFAKSLGLMLDSFNTYEVTIEALNGKDLQEKITQGKKNPFHHAHRCEHAGDERDGNRALAEQSLPPDETRGIVDE